MISPYKILNAYFIETGTCPDMSSRNLMTQMSPEAVNNFAYATDNGKFLTADNMSGVSGNILISDPNSERIVDLPNTLKTSRLRFVLRFGIPGEQNGVIYYYSGYTDFNGWNSQFKDFDPNMRLYINSVQQVSQAVRHTPQGLEPFVQVIECTHLIHPSNLGTNPSMWQAQFDQHQMGMINQPSALRPYDLMNKLATNQHDIMQGSYGVPTIDSRPSIDLLKIDRRNTVPSTYLSKSVEGLVNGYSEANDNIASANTATAFEAAAGKTAEQNPFSDRFLNPLITEMGLQQNGFVTWNQLATLHPELHITGVTSVNSKGAGQRADMYMANAQEYDTMVGDRRPSTDFYNRVMASLPGLMLTSLIVFGRVHVTNMTPDNSIQCFITDPISFVDIPPGYLIGRIPFLQEKFKALIFGDLGLPAHVPFDAHLSIDAFGESFGSISVNCEQAIPYTAPSYADSMSSQLIAPNGAALPAMANDINYLVTHIF